MPNLTQIPPQNNSYIKIPRAEILSLVGLTAEAAQKFAEEESHEFQRLKLSRQFGQEAYDLLKAGQKVAIVKIGSSQFPIETAKTYAEFVYIYRKSADDGGEKRKPYAIKIMRVAFHVFNALEE